MGFNFDEASKYYSKQEIINHLESAGSVDFDFKGARNSGASDDDIYEYLYQSNTKQSEPTQIPKEYETAINKLSSEPQIQQPTEPQMQQPTEPQMDFTILPKEEMYVSDVTATKSSMSIPVFDERGNAEFETINTQDLPMKMEKLRDERIEKAQKIATESTFPQLVADPETGEMIPVQPQGLQTDIPFFVAGGGKLAMFSIEGALGKQTTGIAKAASIIEEEFMKNANLAAIGDGLTKEAKLLLIRNPQVTKEEIQKWVEGVPKADQAYVIARRLRGAGRGYIQKAVASEGDLAASYLRADLQRAGAKVEETIGSVDVQLAKAKYGDMMDEVAKDYKNVRDASVILKDLDFLDGFYGVAPSAGNTTITKMKAVLGENPKISLVDALEFRSDINYLLSKAGRGKEKIKLNNVKNNLDNFINSVATPEQKVMIDEAIDFYSTTMQNRDTLAILQKHTNEDGLVDWIKTAKDLEEAGLKTPESKAALEITKQFAEKFGNDIKLYSAATTKGVSEDGGGWIYILGLVSNTIRNTLARAGDLIGVETNRGAGLRIQNAIKKSILKSKTPLDFVDNIKASEYIPDTAKEKLTEPVVKMIEYKPKPVKISDTSESWGKSVPAQLPRTPENIPQDQVSNISEKMIDATKKLESTTMINEETFSSFIKEREALNEYKKYLGNIYNDIINESNIAAKAKVRNAVSKFRSKVSKDMNRDEFTKYYDEFLKSLGKAGVESSKVESPAEFYRRWKANKE